MYCPKCDGEYRDGFYECADCRVPLVEEPPARPEASDEGSPSKHRLVTVLKIGDASIVPVAKSLLENADIAYFMRGEQLQDLLGGGRMGTGFNIIAGPMEIQVEEVREAEARLLLSQLDTRE